MSQLQVKGNVFFSPGPWGPAKGIDSAQIEIVEHDLASSQVIWTGSTGASNGGAFQGRTGEWQSTVSVPVWIVDDPGSAFPPRPPRGHWGSSTQPDPTDALLLTARITKAPYGTFTVPFVYVNDTTTSPPIFAPPTWVPAIPAPLMVAKVTAGNNTASYNDPLQLSLAVQAAADTGQPFSVDIYDPQARDAFAHILMQTEDQLMDYLAPHLRTVPPLPPPMTISALTGTEETMIILAIAVLVLAVGAAVLTVMIGIAIIYALSLGYGVVEVELVTDTSGGGQHLHVSFRK